MAICDEAAPPELYTPDTEHADRITGRERGRKERARAHTYTHTPQMVAHIKHRKLSHINNRSHSNNSSEN